MAADIDGAAKTLLALPGVLGSLQKLSELGPAIDRIAGFEEQLTEIARVVPVLEELAELRTSLEALATVIEPLSALTRLVPTLESLERSIAGLEVTIGSVSTTLSPLQSTTERVGKVVDRLAARKKAGGEVGSGS